jgi:hypothetical protein
MIAIQWYKEWHSNNDDGTKALSHSMSNISLNETIIDFEYEEYEYTNVSPKTSTPKKAFDRSLKRKFSDNFYKEENKNLKRKCNSLMKTNIFKIEDNNESSLIKNKI